MSGRPLKAVRAEERELELKLYGQILDELEETCTSFSLDDEGDRKSTARILAARLVRRGVKLT